MLNQCNTVVAKNQRQSFRQFMMRKVPSTFPPKRFEESTIVATKFNKEVTKFNREAWDKVAAEGDRYFRAITPGQIEAARGGEWKIRITPTKPVPRNWLEPLAGKRVLLLGGGGGQQSPILAALGASVVVLDLSPHQLKRDTEIAIRENLMIETTLGDMANLSEFENQSFDMVLNPCSVCYCPNVRDIWKESFRVLRKGGTFIAGLINPLYYIFDAQCLDRGQYVVRHKIPYSDHDLGDQLEEIVGVERPTEFGHSLNDLIGGQIDVGFQLTGFFEDGWGGGDPLSKRINTFFATCCRKP